VSEFEEWFRRTRKLLEEMDKMIDEMIRESFGAFRGREGRVIGPYYYGFSITIGPDGVPRVREWGNIRLGIRPRISEAIEPFMDVIEEEDVVRVVMDMPGVEKEDINVEATENEVVVSAERGDRKYRKTVTLPCRVKPETAKATYKNGVLTITIEKAEKEKRAKGLRIKVE
jgi:HSP20 family protein